ncbi:MAG: hypothetical protein IT373_29800, partial [Polyangiaceae bacterium]|nr:hypothetical protein [Polyangiaceae bacterium]
ESPAEPAEWPPSVAAPSRAPAPGPGSPPPTTSRATPGDAPATEGARAEADRPAVVAAAAGEEAPPTRRAEGVDLPHTEQARQAGAGTAADGGPARPARPRKKKKKRRALEPSAPAPAVPAVPSPRPGRRSSPLPWLVGLALVAAAIAYVVAGRDAKPEPAPGTRSEPRTAEPAPPSTPEAPPTAPATPPSPGPSTSSDVAPAVSASAEVAPPASASAEVAPAASASAPAAPAAPLEPGARAELRARVTEALGKARWDDVASTMLELLDKDAAALGDAAGRELAIDVMTALVREAHPRSDEVSRAIALAEGGTDLLYALVERSGVAPTSRRAAELLREPEVRARMSPAVAIAFDLREARCDKKVDLLPRAVADGDLRAIASIDITVRPCVSRQNRVDEAVGALRERLHAAKSSAER